jgi:hypothetical protein
MSGNGKRSLTPIAPSESSRFHRQTPAEEGVDRLYNLARFQGVIEIVCVRRATGSIQGSQSAVRRRIERLRRAERSSRVKPPPRFPSRVFAASPNEQAAQTPGGLSLLGCADGLAERWREAIPPRALVSSEREAGEA